MTDDESQQKTIQQILDEERAKSKLHTLSPRSISQMLAIEELKNDPDAWAARAESISVGCKGLTKPKEAVHKSAQGNSKYIYHTPNGDFLSKREALLANPSFGKRQFEYWTDKGLGGFSKELKPTYSEARSEESKQKMSEFKAKFIYITPKGEFNTLREMFAAFSTEKEWRLKGWATAGKNGFSRRPK